MKSGKVSRIFGILFGLCLFPLAYISLVLGIALAFTGNNWFGYLVYIFPALGVLVLVCSFFAKRKPLVTLISNATASIVLLGVISYLAMEGLLFQNIAFAMLYIVPEIFGLLSTVFAGKAYHRQWFKGETPTTPQQ